MTSTPAVSVLMSVRDGAPWVREAVESVLAQTAPDLELIVIDDGSTDATTDVLASFRDSRLRVERQPPAGLTRALNRARGLARAPLLARLDADDLALPERLARQRAFLDSHPEVGLLGTGAREVDASGREVGIMSPPEGDAALRRALIRENPFVHSSVMMRRSAWGVSHAAAAIFDPVDARQRPDRNQELQCPEHGGATDAVPGYFANDLFCAKWRVAPERGRDHASPRRCGPSAGIAEPSHHRGRRRRRH